MTPENIALRLVKEFGIVEPPVDVEEICRSLGIELRFYNGGKRLLGVSSSFETPQGTVTIFTVSSMLGKARKRFTIAHELGHYMLGHFGKKRAPELERAANRFASELLMPEDIIAFEWCWYALDDLARRYAVSEEAMKIRIRPYNLVMRL